MSVVHLNLEQLEAGVENIKRSPKDGGVLECIVIRPGTNQRVDLQECELSPEGGVHGDNWASRTKQFLPDGNPNPAVQVSLMNSRTVDLLAQDRARWPLAGDNLYVDLDLSRDNLQPGQQLAIGSVVLEVTDVPHNGCAKFVERYGPNATGFVNSKSGKALRLRGVYAKIVKAGTVKVGDSINKV